MCCQASATALSVRRYKEACTNALKHFPYRNTVEEQEKRQRFIDYIQGHVGTLINMPWNQIPTEELEQLSDGIAVIVFDSIMQG